MKCKKLISYLLLFFTINLFSQSYITEHQFNQKVNTFDNTLSSKEVLSIEEYNFTITNVMSQEANVKIYYYTVFAEARVIFICTYRTYDQGIAITSIRNILSDFMKSKKFYHYNYLTNDKTRLSKNEKTKEIYIHYETYVKFNK